MKIIVDAFGGDNAPKEIVLGAVDATACQNDLLVVLVGNKTVIEEILKTETYDKARLTIVDAKEVITNEDVPTTAIKQKKDSSLVRALEILANDETAGGFVSAGSTGAVLAGAFMKVGRIRGISRPALAPILPSLKGKGVILCDCGANVDCKPQNLQHFALMGKAFAEAMLDAKNPRVALLSNGTEDKKGNELNHEVFGLLKADKSINFVGNCEARDVLSGDYDVIVADGFDGNIALKAAEGTANAIFSIIMDGVNNGGARAKLGALLLKPVLRGVKHKMDYNSQGGACFLGINKVIIKSHGASKRKSICASILQAATLSNADVCQKIKDAVKAETNNTAE
ncbi:MAG: phosphate acyltransferase PlsX [Clostridia bacterium]